MQYTAIEILSMVKYLRMKGQFNYKIISTDMNNAFVVFLFISLIAACRVKNIKDIADIHAREIEIVKVLKCVI